MKWKKGKHKDTHTIWIDQRVERLRNAMSTLHLHSAPTPSPSFPPITSSRFFRTSRISLPNAVVSETPSDSLLFFALFIHLFNGTRVSSVLQGDRSSAVGEREAERQRVCRQRKRDSELRRGAERADSEFG